MKISFGLKQLVGGVVSRRRKAEVRGSSAGGHKARIFRTKNRMTCDLRCATMWLSSEASLGIKKIPIFSMHFLAFLETTSLPVHISIGL
jgi:hypothetical protein